MQSNSYRIGISTIQWYATPAGLLDFASGPTLKELAPYLKSLGFSATPAKTPDDISVSEVKAALEAGGLQAMPSVIMVPNPEEDINFADALESAKRYADRQRQIGLTEAFLIPNVGRGNPIRMNQPAVGAGFEQGRLDEVTDRIGRIAEAVKQQGLKAAIHAHVGTWVEMEDELRHVLRSIDADTLALGPDTGHLSWAGVDVPAFFAEFASRVGPMHLKDINFEIRDRARAQNKTYAEAALMGLWAEPGTGSVDLVKGIHALGPHYDGWIVIEVDRPTVDAYESAKISADWVQKLKRPNA